MSWRKCLTFFIIEKNVRSLTEKTGLPPLDYVHTIPTYKEVKVHAILYCLCGLVKSCLGEGRTLHCTSLVDASCWVSICIRDAHSVHWWRWKYALVAFTIDVHDAGNVHWWRWQCVLMTLTMYIHDVDSVHWWRWQCALLTLTICTGATVTLLVSLRARVTTQSAKLCYRGSSATKRKGAATLSCCLKKSTPVACQ